MRAGALAAILLAAALPPPAAADAPPARAAQDTTLGGFLRTLSDSTDRYFGLSALPPDTAGHDSLLAHRLLHPLARPWVPARLGFLPDFTFNRVDGPVWGVAAGIGRERVLGRVAGGVGHAAGPNLWLGGGGYRKVVAGPDARWTWRVWAGRRTASMDRDFPDLGLAFLRALVSGHDTKHYLRLDGVEAGFERETATWRVGAAARDMLESPRRTTATWNLRGREPTVVDNLPAAVGRAREIEFTTAWRLPLLPLTGEVAHRTSSEAIGSDFEYRRTRLSLSGDFPLGRIAAVVPQVAYGRLSGTPVPQAAFYLGGSHSLRSLSGASRGGAGMALARLDVIGVTDVLAWARIPHPSAFPIQIGGFAAAGAVWGFDPYGGPTLPGVDWPNAEDWMSEAGVSIHYQPGIPDPAGFLRLSYAWALGPGRDGGRWSATYVRAIDLVRTFER